MSEKYEEYNILSPFWGWVLLLFFSLLIISFGLVAHALVPEVRRTWDFGQFPIVPSVNPYSTVEFENKSGFQRQLQPLPDVPLNVNTKPPVKTFHFGVSGK